MSSGEPKINYEEPQRSPAGELSWLRTTKVALRDIEGRVIGILGTDEDISEGKRMEYLLRESEARHRSLFQNNHATMLVIEPETGRVVDANDAACRYYGCSLNKLVGKSISEINTLSADELFEEMARAKAETRRYFVFNHRLASGEVRPVEVYSGPVEYGGKRLLYSIVHDISERKKAEEQRESLIIELKNAFSKFFRYAQAKFPAQHYLISLRGHMKTARLLTSEEHVSGAGLSVIEMAELLTQYAKGNSVRHDLKHFLLNLRKSVTDTAVIAAIDKVIKAHDGAVYKWAIEPGYRQGAEFGDSAFFERDYAPPEMIGTFQIDSLWKALLDKIDNAGDLPRATGMKVEPSTVEVAVGQDVNFTARGTSQEFPSMCAVSNVKWTIDQGGIGTLSNTTSNPVTFHALSVGKAKVTATYAGKAFEATVVVTAQPSAEAGTPSSDDTGDGQGGEACTIDDENARGPVDASAPLPGSEGTSTTSGGARRKRLSAESLAQDGCNCRVSRSSSSWTATLAGVLGLALLVVRRRSTGAGHSTRRISCHNRSHM